MKNPETDILPTLREVSNVYDGPKDGYYYFGLDKYERLGRGCFWVYIYLGISKEEEYEERLRDYYKMLRK